MRAEIGKRLYYEMLRIRRVEETIADRYAEQKMRCPVHLSIGQEAVPVGLCAHLSDSDRVFSNHRCHAHYLAKGGNLPKMIAELYGKATGCAKGKGGSMHLVDTNKGMMGASALVGGTIPLAVGTGLAIQMEGRTEVSVCYFGDGCTEEGVFYESLNFAALKKLGVIFVCENNLYATYSAQGARQAVGDIALRGKPFRIPSFQVDGNCVKSVYEVAQDAVERARSGKGPTLLECRTYRWRDHVGPNFDWEVGYRTRGEVESWMKKCPVARLERSLTASKQLLPSQKKRFLSQIEREIDSAFGFAESSPLPEASEILTEIYAQT